MLNKMMNEFMNTYGVEVTEITAKECLDSLILITDEVSEFGEEFLEGDGEGTMFQDDCIVKENVAKEMADIIYVTAQRMLKMGINVDAVMAEVHRSNMSKRVPNSEVEAELEFAKDRYPEAYAMDVGNGFHVLRDAETGKVVKPRCYSKAIIRKGMID